MADFPGKALTGKAGRPAMARRWKKAGRRQPVARIEGRGTWRVTLVGGKKDVTKGSLKGRSPKKADWQIESRREKRFPRGKKNRVAS